MSFRIQDNGQNGNFGCPLGSIRAFWDLYEIGTPNHFYGTGMAALTEVELSFRVVQGGPKI